MSKENDYRTGIDDRPLTKEEYEKLKAGGSLYRRIKAPIRPQNGNTSDLIQHNTVEAHEAAV